jgi:hypothetical protein
MVARGATLQTRDLLKVVFENYSVVDIQPCRKHNEIWAVFAIEFIIDSII